MPYPVAAQPYFPAAYSQMSPPLPVLINQLGQGMRVDSQGLAQFNRPLVQKIVAHRERAIPPLINFIAQRNHQPHQHKAALVEAVFTAEKLAEAKVPGVYKLYSVLSPLNTWNDPLFQIYLAGLYRDLQLWEAFGPMVSTLIQNSVDSQRQPMNGRGNNLNPSEELGGSILKQIAVATANETVKQLLPHLPQSRPLLAPPPPGSPFFHPPTLPQ